MKFKETSIPGAFEVELQCHKDSRGRFVKTFHRATFLQHGLETDFVESYFSVSHKNVIRGMHIQIPPADHVKLVSVQQGKILDVLLDTRGVQNASNPLVHSTILSADLHNMMYIPPGVAHGFLSLSSGAVVLYQQTSEYNPSCDRSIAHDSFGFRWPIADPIVSSRDRLGVLFQDFRYFLHTNGGCE